MPSYATLTDLTTYGISAAALVDVDTTVQQNQLDAASALADGYLRERFQLPLTAPYPLDLKMNVCALAALGCLTVRGFDPDNPADAAIVKGHKMAIEWLRDIAKGLVNPGVADSQSGGTFAAQMGPLVQSSTKRGW